MYSKVSYYFLYDDAVTHCTT